MDHQGKSLKSQFKLADKLWSSRCYRARPRRGSLKARRAFAICRPTRSAWLTLPRRNVCLLNLAAIWSVEGLPPFPSTRFSMPKVQNKATRTRPPKTKPAQLSGAFLVNLPLLPLGRRAYDSDRFRTSRRRRVAPSSLTELDRSGSACPSAKSRSIICVPYAQPRCRRRNSSSSHR